MPDSTDLSFLQLLQLSDSALPIGSISHSFGLETLAFDEDVCPASLTSYLEQSLSESLLMDAVFCREAHARALQRNPVDDLNEQLSALRMARETREASLTMGRRFAALAAGLYQSPELKELASLDKLHHCISFGYTLGVLSIEADLTVSAYLHQALATSISSAQRLMPLGQKQANQIAWDLKPAILEAVKRTTALSFADVCSFAHLPEMASMRHPCLPTRLFVS